MHSLKYYKRNWKGFLQTYYAWAVYMYEHKKFPPRVMLNWTNSFADEADVAMAKKRMQERKELEELRKR